MKRGTGRRKSDRGRGDRVCVCACVGGVVEGRNVWNSNCVIASEQTLVLPFIPQAARRLSPLR